MEKTNMQMAEPELKCNGAKVIIIDYACRMVLGDTGELDPYTVWDFEYAGEQIKVYQGRSFKSLAQASSYFYKKSHRILTGEGLC